MSLQSSLMAIQYWSVFWIQQPCNIQSHLNIALQYPEIIQHMFFLSKILLTIKSGNQTLTTITTHSCFINCCLHFPTLILFSFLTIQILHHLGAFGKSHNLMEFCVIFKDMRIYAFLYVETTIELSSFWKGCPRTAIPLKYYQKHSHFGRQHYAPSSH